MTKKKGRFSGMIDGLEAEKNKVTATSTTQFHGCSSDPSSRIDNTSPNDHCKNNPDSFSSDNEEPCDGEPSSYVEFLEQEVDRLTDYAKKAEETKDSLRGLENLRKHLAYLIFAIIGAWLIAVFALVFLGSMDVYYFKGTCDLSERNLFFRATQILPSTCDFIGKGSVLNLSQEIVIALITTTTVNILGLAYIVARWLYPEEKRKKSKRKNKSHFKKNSKR